MQLVFIPIFECIGRADSSASTQPLSAPFSCFGPLSSAIPARLGHYAYTLHLSF